MKKLIKTDLTMILKLIPIYFPVPDKSVDRDIQAMRKSGDSDFLFLARRNKTGLFDLPSVYTPGSAANLIWTRRPSPSCLPTAALFFHVERSVANGPWGSVTLLNYPDSVRDVETFAPLAPGIRARHIRLIAKRYIRDVRYCSMMEVIQYLKTGGERKWMSAEK